MDSEDMLFKYFWMMIGVVLCTLILTIGFNMYVTKVKLTDMVKSGANPIAAACSLGSITSMCTVYIVSNKEKSDEG